MPYKKCAAEYIKWGRDNSADKKMANIQLFLN